MAHQNSDPEILLYIRGAKKTKKLNIPGSITVRELKDETAKQFSISPEKIKLSFAGKHLKDSEKLKDKNIRNGFTVFLMIKPVIHQQYGTTLTSQQIGFSNGVLFEPYPGFYTELSLLPYSALLEFRRLLSNHITELMRTISAVISLVFNPAILRSFNLQNVNLTLLPPIETMLSEMDRNAPTNTEVLRQYFADGALEPISNPDTLRILATIAETPTLDLDARISSLLIVLFDSPDLQNYPLDGIRKNLSALKGTQQLLQTVDMRMADENINALPLQASRTSRNHSIMSNLITSAPSRNIVNERPQENQYQQQLNALESMGFSNREENLRALTSTSGNVRFAIHKLLKTTQDLHETDSSG